MLVSARAVDVLRTTEPTDEPSDGSHQIPNNFSPERLRDVATYAEKLAEHKECETRLEEEADHEKVGERPDNLLDIPSKAMIIIKEINDNRYYYWQWREGDAVTSKYKGPVAPD